MSRTIMPSFQKFPAEAQIICNLLTGYTDLELSLLNCVQVVRDDFDAVLKAMFRVRGETNRVKVADGLGLNRYRTLGLDVEFSEAIDAMRHCVRIRNQYAHCIYWDDNSGHLAIAYLEDAADLDQPVNNFDDMPVFHVDVPLLTAQEVYFCYASDLLWWINHEGRHRDGKPAAPVSSKPIKIQKPPRNIP
jgi:hypothetical protein